MSVTDGIPSKPFGLKHSYMQQCSCEARNIIHTVLLTQANGKYDMFGCQG